MGQDIMPGLELQLLSASDPQARANMMRHTVALRHMLDGRLDEGASGVLTGANFGATPESVERYKALTRADGRDRVMIGFDVDDPLGPPETYGLWHHQNGAAVFYDRCIPWAPPTTGPAVLIAGNADGFATFRSRPGAPLLRRPGVPGGDVGAGIARAKARLAKLVLTPLIRDVVGDVHMRIHAAEYEPCFVTVPSDLG